MAPETIIDVVKKLVGPIRPVGESRADKTRLENLKAMVKVIDELVEEVDNVAIDFKDYSEHSIKVANKYAKDFIDNLRS